MRIAQVAPLYESVPPKTYGGTERVVSYLTEELVRKGHEVTLFASADSNTNARFIPVVDESLRLSEKYTDPLVHHVLLLQKVLDHIHEFDIVHYHIDYFHYPLSRMCGYPQISTLHGRLDIPDLQSLYREYDEMPLVSISDNQRLPLAFANWISTVYHGLPNEYVYFPDSGDYLAFVGRISPEKGVDRAIKIAQQTNIKLKIAAKIEKADINYFENSIRPLLDDPLVEFVGEIREDQKDRFYGNAKALLFPIAWPEPFGLVMIEAIACGTPVVAFNNGSVPEIIRHEKTGFIVNSIEEAVNAVNNIGIIERRNCRKDFEERFLVSRMANDYLKVYEIVLEENSMVPFSNQLMRKQ
ncbi:glycosyltransferase family 4 protein [Echinicola salinicaeni]|uniref:glycosyltransferase family 4 protein n=1 Tax=Echinicola salinicaeni TaxID=2762757 RepID=UPI0016477F8E|nr:glycosyltransferase family 4 protein [Echinicola salinicaeni]